MGLASTCNILLRAQIRFVKQCSSCLACKLTQTPLPPFSQFPSHVIYSHTNPGDRKIILLPSTNYNQENIYQELWLWTLLLRQLSTLGYITSLLSLYKESHTNRTFVGWGWITQNKITCIKTLKVWQCCQHSYDDLVLVLILYVCISSSSTLFTPIYWYSTENSTTINSWCPLLPRSLRM